VKTYLVGGAVRDKLMKRGVTERDWVVVGSSPTAMLALGFESVGKDFPVFLHPTTREEYALARTERKISRGYGGFEFDTAKVTLEEDLKRRDLTINAMAETEEGQIIDPYGGRDDLQKKILRHVSEAFAEDPVRVLRVARFAARFAEERFTVAPETLQLMRNMVESGECDFLVPERIWKEMSRVLQENTPVVFFQTLRACGALKKILPEIEENPSVDHLLIQITAVTNNPIIRFAAFTQTLEEPLLIKLCRRLKVPSDYQELALLVIRYHQEYEAINNKNAEQILKLLEHVDVFRRPARMFDFMTACLSAIPACQMRFQKAFEVTAAIDIKQIIAALNTTEGNKIKEAIHIARREAIEKAITQS
jgi:tRNA nucleotidyltransferase (CCA-adding enzyme)